MAAPMCSRSFQCFVGHCKRGAVYTAFYRHQNGRIPRHQNIQKAWKSDGAKKKFSFDEYISRFYKPVPISVGLMVIGFIGYKHFKQRNDKILREGKLPPPAYKKFYDELNDPDSGSTKPSDLLIILYRMLPHNRMSQFWGKVHNGMDLPVFLRRPCFNLYIWMFGCNLEEAKDQNLENYKNLGEFFRRELRPECRPIDQTTPLTSPCDGRVLHFNKVECSRLEQVKGIEYSLQDFLGNYIAKHKVKSTSDDTIQDIPSGITDENQNNQVQGNTDQSKMSAQEYHDQLLSNPDNELYHCIIYLAPGDYHRFHSPTDWAVTYRKHFPGELLSVNPGMARWIQGLFKLNERVVYYGQWEHGFFSMAAVGATNVGSIKVYFDEHLTTNSTKKTQAMKESESVQEITGKPEKLFSKGDPFGEFNLGSTIVLVFEAPKSFKFDIDQGETIKYGEPVGR